MAKESLTGKEADTMPPPLDKSVVLVGHMGSGKSHIGRRIAARLGLDFADSDKEIEKVAGLSIADIFDLYDETRFRELEHREIKRLLDAPPMVIATGGGTFVQPDCQALILKKALAIWLKARPETLAGRITNINTRPLLRGKDPVATLTELAKTRDSSYEKAHLTVDTDGLESDWSVAKVLTALATRRSKASP